MKIYDITIVGAGPVGLFGAFYAGMREMSINIIDSLPQVGGQLSALYPEKYIFDMPGFPKVLAKDLVRDMWAQAQLGKPDLHLNEKITKISPQPSAENRECYCIETITGNKHYTKTVMLALGMGAFQPQKLVVAGLAEKEGKNVHYFLKPLDTYKNSEVLIIGGGDSAADWCLAMAKADEQGKVRAKNTTIIHRGPNFRAHESTVREIQQTKAEILLTHELSALQEEAQNDKTKLRATLENNLTKDKREIIVDHIIICIGYLAKLDFVKESGLAMKGNAIMVNDRMETNIPGIFAVGDVCSHDGKLK